MKTLTDKIERMHAGHWMLIYAIILTLMILLNSCASITPAERYAKQNKAYTFKNHKVK